MNQLNSQHTSQCVSNINVKTNVVREWSGVGGGWHYLGIQAGIIPFFSLTKD